MCQTLHPGDLPPPSGHGATWSLSKRGPRRHLHLDKSELYSPPHVVGGLVPGCVAAAWDGNPWILCPHLEDAMQPCSEPQCGSLLGVGVSVGVASYTDPCWLRLKRVPFSKAQAAAGVAVRLSLFHVWSEGVKHGSCEWALSEAPCGHHLCPPKTLQTGGDMQASLLLLVDWVFPFGYFGSCFKVCASASVCTHMYMCMLHLCVCVCACVHTYLYTVCPCVLMHAHVCAHVCSHYISILKGVAHT